MNRLWAASAAMAVTLLCILILLIWPQSTFGMAALFSFGFCAFSASIALIMSARREETVHGLATELEGRKALPEGEGDGLAESSSPALLSATDGSV